MEASPPIIERKAVHIPVLLQEVLDTLLPAAKAAEASGRPVRILDGTLGLAGHSNALLDALAAQGHSAQLCGLDRDQEALLLANQALAHHGDKARTFHMEYALFPKALASLGWDSVDIVLLDLGLSSLQIDFTERGFSLHGNGPLDMRMNPQGDAGLPSARELVNRADFDRLRRIIEELGEDPQAGRIARAIVDARQQGPIESTKQLADIVYHSYPAKWRATARNHPATRTFQALRMEVNRELPQLESFLHDIMPRISTGGRLAIISFHSLEDRMVKQSFKLWATDCLCPPHIPICRCRHKAEMAQITRKPLVASADEARQNSRSSSAKLRVAEKLAQQNARGRA